MSWITSLMMASGWSCAENAQAKAHDDDDDDDVDDDGEENDEYDDGNNDDDDHVLCSLIMTRERVVLSL